MPISSMTTSEGMLMSTESNEELRLNLPLNGTVTDYSPYAHNVTSYNVQYTEDEFGNPNNAALFNGNNSHIDIADDPSLHLGYSDFSLSFKTKHLPLSRYTSILAKIAQDLPYSGINVFSNIYSYPGTLLCRVDDDNYVTTSQPLTDNAWHDFTFIREGNQLLKLYWL